MDRVEVYLGLGSNLGDRKARLDEALQKIGQLPGTELEAVSDVIETAADGFEGADFLNCCCRIETSLTPRELLKGVKEIEAQMGRKISDPKYDKDGKRLYSDRPIDIDILLYGSESINEEDLQIPHPRMQERDFVMIPLEQIIKNKQ